MNLSSSSSDSDSEFEYRSDDLSFEVSLLLAPRLVVVNLKGLGSKSGSITSCLSLLHIVRRHMIRPKHATKKPIIQPPTKKVLEIGLNCESTYSLVSVEMIQFISVSLKSPIVLVGIGKLLALLTIGMVVGIVVGVMTILVGLIDSVTSPSIMAVEEVGDNVGIDVGGEIKTLSVDSEVSVGNKVGKGIGIALGDDIGKENDGDEDTDVVGVLSGIDVGIALGS